MLAAKHKHAEQSRSQSTHLALTSMPTGLITSCSTKCISSAPEGHASIHVTFYSLQ